MKTNTTKTIAVVGPHYAGKSTFCRILAKKHNFIKIEENWQGNPFKNLSHDVFGNPKGFFPSQVWFLLQNIKNLHEAEKLRKEGKTVVLDTFIYSTLIFAHTVLNKTEMKLFKEFFTAVEPIVPLPDLIIYLSADPKFLYETRRMQRVKQKSGPDEDEQTSYDWYKKVWDLNEHYFSHWNKTSLLKIDVQKYDITDLKTLENLLKATIF